MSASVQLALLEQNRDALLRAEIAALLHDVGKLHSDFLVDNPRQQLWAKYHHLVLRRLARGVTAVNNLSSTQIACAIQAVRAKLGTGTVREQDLKREARSSCSGVSDNQAEVLLGEALVPDDFLSSDLVDLLETGQITLGNASVALGDLIEEHAIPFFSRRNGQRNQRSQITELIQHADFCDSSADKGEASSPQNNETFVATAFGMESLLKPQAENRTFCSRLVEHWNDREKLLGVVKARYQQALGDTRRSANDVTLWDHSFAVATLLKSALAHAVLAGQLGNPRSIRWRLLRVNVDVLALFAKAVRIPDLLGYQRAVDEAFDAVKRLVEEEYPLGNEVYRDTTGIYFTFPDLDLMPELAEEIRHRVEVIEPELAPRIAVTADDGKSAQEQLKTILGKARREAKEELQRPFVTEELARKLQNDWQAAEGAELCPVCRLRPKLPDADACKVCDERRARRAKHWAAMLSYNVTIWLDEVADEYGRVALIAGAFGLDDWLSGQLVQTLLVKADLTNGAFVPKNPSPARLRRIWETTQRFWQETLGEIQELIPKPSGRLRLTPQTMPAKVENFHTYDLVVVGRRVGVFRDERQFITCDNLDYFAKVAQVSLQQALQLGQSYELWTPIGYGERTKRIASITLQSVQPDKVSYSPVLSILSDPQMFMAVVPARHALAVIKAIKAKYEREMGKVRNRLPLTLGVVYFGRRTPLAAAIEAARRMLDRPARSEAWEVLDKQDQPAEVRLTLSRGDRVVTLSVPTMMGDNVTPDNWYPYWCVEGKPTDRKRCFVGPDNEHWVHVAELRPGDRVGFYPSTFDYEFLDTTARRFEVLYDRDGARRSTERRHRPYLLEELDQLGKVWGQLTASLSATQIMQLVSLIEAKREAWGEPRGTTAVSAAFRQFVCDALHEARAYSETLADAAVRGWLADLIELHCTLQKECNETEATQQSKTT